MSSLIQRSNGVYYFITSIDGKRKKSRHFTGSFCLKYRLENIPENINA